MQQAIRRRPRRPAAWQAVLARWLLAIAVVLTLSPSADRSAGVALAQDRASDDLPIGRTVAEDDTHPEHATADDGAPAVPSQEHPASGRPIFAPGVGPATARADDLPQDEPLPATDVPAPTAGNRRVPYSTSSQAAAACSAELGPARAASFGRDDRLVMTYYYYWYDEASLDDPALSQRPPSDPPLDWRSVAWHERQLADMASVGVDVALAVYWGDTATWSLDGLEPMVEARENLLAAGIRAPAIGLFFDTNMYAMILPDRPGLNDLTTDDGLDMLADQIGAFFDRIPPCHRARIDGRPLAFFWRADTEDGDQFKFDDRTFDSLTDRVVADHGERLHLAVERSWQDAARQANVELGAMDVYRWGAALNGPRFEGRTVAVGPGYDDTRIGGRPGYTRERTDGGTYSRDMRQAVMSGTTWLLLETWNELWEGTAIAETEETGRTYLGITARYTALFHQFGREHARDAWFDLGTGHNAYLRRLADAPVEQGMPAEGAGRWGARPFREEEDGTGYFHFALDRRLGLTESRPLTVTVEYFDDGEGSFVLEYDSLDLAPSTPAATVAQIGDDRQVGAQGVRPSPRPPAPAGNRHDAELEQPSREPSGEADRDPSAGDTLTGGPLPSERDSLDRKIAPAARVALGRDDQTQDDAADETLATDLAPSARDVQIDPVYRRTAPVLFENTQTWRTHRFELSDASLRHRQYDGVGDFRLHDMPGPDERLHVFGRVTVNAEPAARPVPYQPESLSFVDPDAREGPTLRWADPDPAPGYLVVLQPFDLVDDTDLHGFTTDDRRRCIGEAQVEPGNETRGLTHRTTCQLRLPPDLEDGVYRWRVQALNADGVGIGQSSDWAYFVVARR